VRRSWRKAATKVVVFQWPNGRARPGAGLSRSGVTGRHVGRGPGLVDEHQPARIETFLLFAPGGAGGGDVRPLLLGGAQSFF